jgi:hypothetical protein
MKNALLFACHLKIITLLSNVKAAMEMTVTPEDHATWKASFTVIKSLFTDMESAMYIEADALAQEGGDSIDQAMELLEKMKQRILVRSRSVDVESSDCAFMIAKASVLTAKVFHLLSSGDESKGEELQSLMGEIDGLYTTCLKIDPQSFEAMVQYSQLKSVLQSDFAGSVNLLETALPLSRTTDEVQDVWTLLILAQSSARAVAQFQENPKIIENYIRANQ